MTTSTKAFAISHYVDGGRAALAANEVISAKTIFERFAGLPASIIALAAHHVGFGELGLGGDDITALMFSAEHDGLAKRLHEARRRMEILRAIDEWSCEGQDVPSDAPFALPQSVLTGAAASKLQDDLDAARRAVWSVEAEAKLVFEAAAHRFQAAMGDVAVAALQEGNVSS